MMFGQKTMINYSLENTPLKAMAIINLVREEVILTSQGCLFGTCTKRAMTQHLYDDHNEEDLKDDINCKHITIYLVLY